tara:strand:- start:29 stop:289 length:261 start_codon:yes stop_codon:yes gene_type:complete
MWKVYKWDGRYIQGEFISEHSTEKAAIRKARKNINYSKVIKSSLPGFKDRGETVLWLDKEDGTPIGMIIKKTRKKTKKGDDLASTG